MMTRRPSLLLCSAAAHGIAIVAIVIASALAPDLLPDPRGRALALELPRIVHVADIPLAPESAPRRAERSPGPQPPVSSASVDPLVDVFHIPDGIPTDDAPAVAVGGSSRFGNAAENAAGTIDGTGLSVTAAPEPPRPKPIVRLHQGIQAPRKIVHVAPEYPGLARQIRVKGIVILEVTVDDGGNVINAHVLRSIALLDKAALTAVLQWKFEPARLNGEAIPVVMTVTINFELN